MRRRAVVEVIKDTTCMDVCQRCPFINDEGEVTAYKDISFQPRGPNHASGKEMGLTQNLQPPQQGSHEVLFPTWSGCNSIL